MKFERIGAMKHTQTHTNTYGMKVTLEKNMFRIFNGEKIKTLQKETS